MNDVARDKGDWIIRHLQSFKALMDKVCSDQGKSRKKAMSNEISSIELYCC